MDVNTSEVVEGLLKGGDVRETIGEAIVKKKKVHNGKVTTVNVNTCKKKKKISAAQKQAAKKAAKAGHTAQANAKRKKSLNVAKKFRESLLDEELDGIKLVCPECGSENLEISFDEETEQTMFTCIDCGKTFMLIDVDTLDALADEEDDEDSEGDENGDGEDEFFADEDEPTAGNGEGDSSEGEGADPFFDD